MKQSVVVLLCAWVSSTTAILGGLDGGAPTLGFPDQTFKSSKATPPKLQITKSGGALAPGLLVFAPQKQEIKGGYLMTDDGELVYSGAFGQNVKVQQLQGKPVLSHWTGISSGKGFGYGKTEILDTSYRTIHTVCSDLGLYIPKFKGHTDTHTPKCQADLHESQITNDGALIVTGYNVTRADLTSLGGPKNGWVANGMFFKIDIATNKILYKWSALDHVPVSKSRTQLGFAGKQDTRPFDYFHINSIDPVDGGRFLVSSRELSTLFLINKDGSIEWEFNGYNGGDFGPLPKFSSGRTSEFSFQHDGRLESFSEKGATIHFFNNNNPLPTSTKISSGMEYHLDVTKKSSSLKKNLHDPSSPSFSYAEGNFQPLPNGNTIVAYGADPVFKEFGPDGDTDVRMTVRFGVELGQMSYRAFRQEWTGNPTAPPDVAIQSGKGYVSWNGATEVTRYVLHTGATARRLKEGKAFKKSGFETEFAVPASAKYVQVAAYKGKTLLKKSKVVQVK